MNIFTHKILSRSWRPIIWSLVLWLAFALGICIFLYNIDIDPNVIVGLIAGLAIFAGYFITHYLEINSRQYEKRFDQHWELLRSLRFFILETKIDIEGKERLLNEFQNSYFGSALFLSRKNYDKLKSVIESLKNFLDKNGDEDALKQFEEKQTDFVNELRKEFTDGEKIKFQTYNIRL